MSALPKPEPPAPIPPPRPITLQERREVLAAVERALDAAPLAMTFEEFLVWADEDTLAEWVNGVVVMTSPASDDHQDIVGFLGTLLRLYVQISRLGVIRLAPFVMKLPTSAREPDVQFIAAAHRDRIMKTYLDGPADLVVEVVSPESAGRDQGDKLNEYEAGGVREYWIIDPRFQQASFYQLDDQGAYRLVAPDGDGVYHAKALPGFWLRVAWLWQSPRPEETSVLLEVGGETYRRYLLDLLDQR